MGFFDDVERGQLEFERDSDTSSTVDEREEQPGPAGQAAPVTGDAFKCVDMSGLAPHAALLAFVEGSCEELMLSDQAKAIAIQTSKLPLDYMVMRLFTQLLQQGQDNSKMQVADFLTLPTFKVSIKRRIQGGLLDPHIPFYVRGCTARFVRHMRQNAASYELPLVVQQRLMNTKKFSSAVGEILSSFRGELRRKIFGSIEDKTDIASTAEKLAIEGYLLSEDHLKQFAFLRHLSEDYNQDKADAQAKKAAENLNAQTRNTGKSRSKKYKVDAAPQKARAYWTYIDAQMLRFRQYTPEKREDLLKMTLRGDRKKYLDPSGEARYFPPANRLLVPQWQANATNVIQVMAEYTLTAAQEGQDVLPTDLRPTHEGEGPANQEDQPEEEDEGTSVGDEEYQNGQGGMSTDNDFPDGPSSVPDNDTGYQRSEEHDTLDGAKTTPLRPRNANLGGASGNNISQRQPQ